MAKKKDQDKFNEYSINTDDAWEIDDRTMTLKMLDSESSNGDESDNQQTSVGISKQASARRRWETTVSLHLSFCRRSTK